MRRGAKTLLVPGLLALQALIAGCANPQPPAARPNLSGFSTGFKQGYSDGCDSAGSHGTRRDEGRYKTEADYMMGWNDGYSACRRR